jgi:hypothetical protein
MNDQRAFHAIDILLGGQRADERLEGGQVFRHAFEQEIHFSRQHVALAHLRPAPDACLEGLEVGLFLAGQADEDEARHLIAQRPGIEIGVITFDVTRLFQGAHAAQAGGRRDLGPARQFDIGDAPIGLELGKDAAVDGVELGMGQGRGFRGKGGLYALDRGLRNNISQNGPRRAFMHRLREPDRLTKAGPVPISGIRFSQGKPCPPRNTPRIPKSSFSAAAQPVAPRRSMPHAPCWRRP